MVALVAVAALIASCLVSAPAVAIVIPMVDTEGGAASESRPDLSPWLSPGATPAPGRPPADPARSAPSLAPIRLALRQGRIAAAGPDVKALYARAPKDPEVQALFAIWAASFGDLRSARRALGAEEGTTALWLCANAMVLRAEGDRRRAAGLCRKAAALDPTHPLPWNILGRIHADTGELQKARDCFRKAVDLEPSFVAGYTNLGAAESLLGRREEALRQLQRATQLDPGATRAFYAMGLIYEEQGDLASSAQALERCLAVSPKDGAAAARLAAIRIRQGNPRAAAALAEQMRNKGVEGADLVAAAASLHLGRPSEALRSLAVSGRRDAHAQFLGGLAHALSGDYKAARGATRAAPSPTPAFVSSQVYAFFLGERLSPAALRVEPTDSSTRMLSFLGGALLAAEGKGQPALAEWRRAGQVIEGLSFEGLEPTDLRLDAPALRLLTAGLLFHSEGLIGPSAEYWRKAVDRAPRSPVTNYLLAIGGQRKGDAVDALRWAESAVARAARFLPALTLAGDLSARLGDRNKAAGYLERAVAVRRAPGILVKLGLLYEDLGRSEDASRTYRALIAAEPRFFVGYNQLAWLYARKGSNLEEALKLAKKAEALLPGDSGIQDTIGWILFQRRDHRGALERILKAHEGRPDDPTILYHLGAVQGALGRTEEAKRNLKRALESSSGFAEKDGARTLLESL